MSYFQSTNVKRYAGIGTVPLDHSPTLSFLVFHTVLKGKWIHIPMLVEASTVGDVSGLRRAAVQLSPVLSVQEWRATVAPVLIFFFLSRKIRIFFQDFVFLENQYYQRLYTIKEINLQYEFKYVYPLILFLFIMLLLSYLEKLCYRQDTFWKLKTENQNLKLSKLKLKLQNQSSWVQILILSFPFSIILNKLHNLCVLYAFSNEILI